MESKIKHTDSVDEVMRRFMAILPPSYSIATLGEGSYESVYIDIKDVERCLRTALTTLQATHSQQVEEAVREKIICAAVRASDGYVFRGQWHATALYAPAGLQGMPRYKDERPHGDDQGFVTSTGRYVTREEAWTIAEAAGQLNDRPDKTPGTLYSEDLDYAVTPTTKTSMKTHTDSVEAIIAKMPVAGEVCDENNKCTPDTVYISDVRKALTTLQATHSQQVEEAVRDIIKMADALELECGKDGDKGTKQWMAFKGFRNTIRDKYLTPNHQD